MKGFLLIILVVFSCDDHLIDPYDLVTLGVEGSGNSNFQIIDSHSYDDWKYFTIGMDADTLLSVEVGSSRCNNETWDIAFQRDHIRTNSGKSGSGCGGAYIDRDLLWDEQGFSQFGFEQDNYANGSIIFEFDSSIDSLYQGIGSFGSTCASLELEDWGYFNSNFTLIPTDFRLFVRSASGEKIIAIWITTYYGTGASGGYPFVNYRIFDNEDSSLDCSSPENCISEEECSEL